MSRIAGTPDSVQRVNKLSLYKRNNNQYNNQNSFNEENINNFLNDNKSNDLISLIDLSQKDFTKFLRRLDEYNGIYSTSQLENIDYKNFEEHVFFDSAVDKVITAYQKILNDYPYDKNYFEYSDFISKLDGYSNYILKNEFKKSFGFLKFDGNHKITIKDKKGFLFKDSNDRVEGYLDPKIKRITFNFWLRIDNDNDLDQNNNQVVFKKYNSTNNSGFICYLTRESSSYYINLLFKNEGNVFGKKTKLFDQERFSESLSDIEKFINVAIISDTIGDIRDISFLINGHISNKESINNASDSFPNNRFNNNNNNYTKEDFILGHSESLQNVLLKNNETITFNNLKNVYLDEFKYFQKKLSQKEIIASLHKNVFAQKGLILYLKFNEPGSDYINSHVTLDSSGNKLHGYIQNVSNNPVTNSYSIRNNEYSPLIYETKSPVLFSTFQDNVTRRNELIEEASSYDKVNPNIIFKMFPKHYFVEESEQSDYAVYINKDDYEKNTAGLGSKGPDNSLIVNLLIVWARFFDGLKIYVDAMSEVVRLSYDDMNQNRNIGVLLPLMCKRAGFNFREILPSPLKSKLDGENLTFEDIKSEKTIRQIQNILWKRILINSKFFLQSKGTRKSIKSIFHSFGVDFDKFVKIREFSSINKISKNENYNNISSKLNGITFFNRKTFNLDPIYTINQVNVYSNNKPYAFINQIKHDLTTEYNEVNNIDEIKTKRNGFSKDWSIELSLDYSKFYKELIKNNQSILRINKSNNPYYHVYASRSDIYKDLFNLYLDFVPYSGANKETLDLGTVNFFDNIKYIIISHKEIKTGIYQISSRIKDVGLSNNTLPFKESFKIINYQGSNPALYDDSNDISLSIGNFKYDSNNVSGIGDIQNTNFDGNLYSLRIWKKNLSDQEINSHCLNLENIGTNNIEKDKDLILDAKKKFKLQSSEIQNDVNNRFYKFKNNRIYKKEIVNEELLDLNYLIFKINNNSDSLENYLVEKSYLSKNISFKIDEPNQENRFNIVSYSEDQNKIKNNNFNNFPSNKTPEDFDIVKEARVSIEMSNCNFLNEDISKLEASLDHFTGNIISTTNLYSYQYNSLKEQRSSYFSLLEKEINNKTLFNFFKFFDNALSDIISQAIPTRVGFLGFNYVYESHILERHKYQYKMSDSRIVIHDKNSYNFNREIDIGYRSANNTIGYTDDRNS